MKKREEKGTFYFSMRACMTDRLSEPDDALGRRVKAVGLPEPGQTTCYLSSGQNEVAEYNGQGQRVRYYVHGPTYIDERVVMHNDPVGGGAPTTGSDYIYLLKDLYTVAGLADERGWPVERYDYDAYGKVYMNRCAVLPWAADFDGDGHVDQSDLTVLLDAYGGSGEEPNGPRGWRADLDGDGDVDGSDYVLFADAYNGVGNPPRRPQSPAVSAGCVLTTGPMVASRVGNPFFFTGRRLDALDKQDAGTPHHFTDDYAGLELYDYRARTMDPVLGRFGQRDPVSRSGSDVARVARLRGAKVFGHSPDGLDLYSYARSSPSVRLDPDGKASIVGIGIGGGLIGVGGAVVAACCAGSQLSAFESAYPNNGGLGDRFAHCMMNCLMTLRCPPGTARIASFFQEWPWPSEDWEDDYQANAIGRFCGEVMEIGGAWPESLLSGWSYHADRCQRCCVDSGGVGDDSSDFPGGGGGHFGGHGHTGGWDIEPPGGWGGGHGYTGGW